MKRMEGIIIVVLFALGCGETDAVDPDSSGDVGVMTEVTGGGELQCVAQCDGKDCGPDGCGGSCGVCRTEVYSCIDGVCEPPCIVDCEGKDCGDDGCGGNCGDCEIQYGDDWTCSDGVCVPPCVPDCEDKQCEPDGCGGTCGWCGPDSALLEYHDKFGDDNAKCQGFHGPPENLYKIDHCYFEMTTDMVRKFKVVYSEAGSTVASKEVDWALLDAVEPDSGKPIATITLEHTLTDTDGIAEVKLTTTTTAGQFSLRASVEAEQDVPPLHFDISNIPKSVAPLTVEFSLEGTAAIDVVKVLVYIKDEGLPTCSELDPSAQLPEPDKASAELNDLTAAAKFMGFGNLGPDNSLMVTLVAIGYKINGPVLAAGCTETVVEASKPTVVEIVMNDL